LFKVIMPDGQETVPVDMQTLTQWAVEGRVHAETTIVDTDTNYRFRAADHPYLKTRVAAVPVLTGSGFQPAELPGEPLNPWFSMWTKPRQTIRQIVSTNPTYGVLLIAVLSSFSAPERDSLQSLGLNISYSALVAVSVVISTLLGILGLYIGGALIRWTGSWLGGTADSQETRAALAWGDLPMVWMFPMIPLLILLNLVAPGFANVSNMTWNGLMLFIGAVRFVALIWSIVTTSQAVGEVHGFSGGRGFAAILLAGMIIFAPIFIIAILAGVMIASTR
jgi:hypothetical protein